MRRHGASFSSFSRARSTGPGGGCRPGQVEPERDVVCIVWPLFGQPELVVAADGRFCSVGRPGVDLLSPAELPEHLQREFVFAYEWGRCPSDLPPPGWRLHRGFFDVKV